ncbi:hypothetical protein BHM03_00050672 [Ensete ventricosum]|nr:hypothetical protein BHM03_00050672 [Ensete ventricosum]
MHIIIISIEMFLLLLFSSFVSGADCRGRNDLCFICILQVFLTLLNCRDGFIIICCRVFKLVGTLKMILR